MRPWPRTTADNGPPVLNYTDYLPLEWTPGAPVDGNKADGESVDPDSVELDNKQRVATNLYVLEAVASVEDNVPGRLHEEQPELQQELQRMDAKLQLLMDMVARLLRRDERFPRRHAVRIAVDLVEVAGDLPDMTIGTEGILSLHLHPAIPAALQLFGSVVDDVRDDEGHWLHFQPGLLSDAEKEAVARHVFRHHRRGIAAARQAAPPD